jgi:capsular polysaccharide export protein
MTFPMSRRLFAAIAEEVRNVATTFGRFVASLNTRKGDERSERKFAQFVPAPAIDTRSFLFLQGPQSPFLRRLGLAMAGLGAKVVKINVCGGDVLHWPKPFTRHYRDSRYAWPAFVAGIMDESGITDLILMGDKRPMNLDAICLAQARGIAVHVLEEGYLRPSYITMERGGVNSNSTLPATPTAVRARAASLSPIPPRVCRIANPMPTRVFATVKQHLGNGLLFPFFPRYRTHRPYCILRELTGWLPRYFRRVERRRQADAVMERILAQDTPYFLFPLQLDADMQVRSYSHFGVVDSIMRVVSSFAAASPPDYRLLVKNHPLDNGLIDLRAFLDNFARAAGVRERIDYLDGGLGRRIMDHPQCRGVVLVNSTIGMEALTLDLPVFCLGKAPYAMPGLAVTPQEMPLDAFWKAPRPVDTSLLADFIQVLHADALVPGNFYTDAGIAAAISGILRRLKLAAPRTGEENLPC